jgi:hypothetical protein
MKPIGREATQKMKDLMRILSLAIALALVVVASVAAYAENVTTGSLKVASLQCLQLAMVRDHRHSAAGWPTDCGFQPRSQPKKG